MLIRRGASMDGAIACEAWALDTKGGGAQLRALLESESAFENSLRWQQRRKLWAAFWKDPGHPASGKDVVVYAEREKGEEIAYMLQAKNAGNEMSGPVVFHLQRGHVATLLQTRMPIINRLTHENGRFVAWANGIVELSF